MSKDGVALEVHLRTGCGNLYTRKWYQRARQGIKIKKPQKKNLNKEKIETEISNKKMSSAKPLHPSAQTRPKTSSSLIYTVHEPSLPKINPWSSSFPISLPNHSRPPTTSKRLYTTSTLLCPVEKNVKARRPKTSHVDDCVKKGFRPKTGSLLNSRHEQGVRNTFELEREIKKDIEFEFNGLSDFQREVMLVLLHKTEEIRTGFSKKVSKSTNKFPQLQEDFINFEKAKSNSLVNSNSIIDFDEKKKDQQPTFELTLSNENDKDILDEMFEKLAFPVERYKLKSFELSNAEEEAKSSDSSTNTQPIFGGLQKVTEKRVLSISEKFDSVISSTKSKIKVDQNGDRIDFEFHNKIKNVTNGLRSWLQQTLESDVDITEYIQQNIINPADPQKTTPILKFPQHCLYKSDVPEKDEEESRKYEFVHELEVAMSTWKPTFLNKKKGKMLNIISETVAPKTLLTGLDTTFGVKVSNRVLIKDPIFSDGKREKTPPYGAWYINPKKWNELQQESIKSKHRKRFTSGETSFVQKRLQEMQKERDKEEADIRNGKLPTAPTDMMIKVDLLSSWQDINEEDTDLDKLDTESCKSSVDFIMSIGGLRQPLKKKLALKGGPMPHVSTPTLPNLGRRRSATSTTAPLLESQTSLTSGRGLSRTSLMIRTPSMMPGRRASIAPPA